MALTTRVKDLLVRTLTAALGRQVALLPKQAGGTPGILAVEAGYRIAGGVARVTVRPPGPGRLEIGLSASRGQAQRMLAEPLAVDCGAACVLEHDPAAGELRVDGRVAGKAQPLEVDRRLRWELHWRGPAGEASARTVGQYYPGAATEHVGADYFQGGNYADYDAQAAGEAAAILDWLGPARGKLLEVGCATGAALQGLRGAGFDAYGVDISDWAVEQARQRLGPGRCFVADVARGGLPAELLAAGPFDHLLLWNVFEHFPDPFAALRNLAAAAAPGARLVISTSNADGLSRKIWGADWEGHFDYTHFGVDVVGASSLRAGLPELGWEIDRLETWQIWDSNPDPLRAALRDACGLDARFRQLLKERDLGDLLRCAATRRPR